MERCSYDVEVQAADHVTERLVLDISVWRQIEITSVVAGSVLVTFVVYPERFKTLFDEDEAAYATAALNNNALQVDESLGSYRVVTVKEPAAAPAAPAVSLSDVAIIGIGASGGVFVLALGASFAVWRRRSARVGQTADDIANETRAGDVPLSAQAPHEARYGEYDYGIRDDSEDVPLPAFART
jgi:hypothetical protein